MRLLALVFIFAIAPLTNACPGKIEDALSKSHKNSYIRVGDENTYEQQKSGTKQVFKYYKASIVSKNGKPTKVYRAVVKINPQGCELDSLVQDKVVEFKF